MLYTDTCYMIYVRFFNSRREVMNCRQRLNGKGSRAEDIEWLRYAAQQADCWWGNRVLCITNNIKFVL